ncbi:hypothetical protein [Rhodococcus erythropolis]|uniref:hypothetical protein n=1 Tax=Rhodococcus erythropolis TaxID=1833 RepID=UPI00210E6F4E|nr:hypothetical protein [Rhodococcus erythropolis]
MSVGDAVERNAVVDVAVHGDDASSSVAVGILLRPIPTHVPSTEPASPASGLDGIGIDTAVPSNKTNEYGGRSSVDDERETRIPREIVALDTGELGLEHQFITIESEPEWYDMGTAVTSDGGDFSGARSGGDECTLLVVVHDGHSVEFLSSCEQWR